MFQRQDMRRRGHALARVSPQTLVGRAGRATSSTRIVQVHGMASRVRMRRLSTSCGRAGSCTHRRCDGRRNCPKHFVSFDAERAGYKCVVLTCTEVFTNSDKSQAIFGCRVGSVDIP